MPYLDEGGPVLALAHRGGSFHPGLEGLENTIEAFRHAVSLGYGYLETDVHVTSDGVLLAFHDNVLDRVTDQVGTLATTTYAEVRRARVGGREEIPRFVDLLDAFPDVRFNVDLKSDGAVPVLAALLRTQPADRVLVGSFSRRRLRRFRRLTGGRVPTSAHPWEVALFRLSPSGRLAGRLAPAPAALQVPHRRGPVTVVTPGFVRRAHAAGRHVHVWTVDDTRHMHELLDLGVDGLVTDRTDLLKDVLVQRRLWREHR